DSSRLMKMGKVLTEFPDNLIYQWTRSRLARDIQGLHGSARRESSDFFYRDYENNKLIGYDHSALASLYRSLEMQPTVADRQFEMARALHRRGWKHYEVEVLNRVQELGLQAQSRIQDYREGFQPDSSPSPPTVPKAKLILSSRLQSIMEGPPEGQSTFEYIVQHSLFHQPALKHVSVSEGEDSALAVQVRKSEARGGVHVNIREWGENVSAKLTFQYPGNSVKTRELDASGRMKIWKMNNEIIRTILENWPWEGEVYNVKREGAWVNLGRVHGINEGDSISIQGRAFKVTDPRQNRSFVKFSTPFYRTQIQRGRTARLTRRATKEAGGF
ncbi:MAG: hypothetical protein ABEJ65_08210, partial [bacterium]